MRLSKFVWSLYSKSRSGKDAIAKSVEMLKIQGPGLSELDEADVKVAYAFYSKALRRKIASMEDAADLYESLLDKGLTVELDDGGEKYKATFGGGSEGGQELWLKAIHPISFGLSIAHPEHFCPYFFRCHFNQLRSICAEFDIAVPVLPGKASWRERALFYSRMNDSLQEFRRIHDLDPAELCAFLYRFAPEHLAAEQEPLPPAAKAWLIMGGARGPEDFHFVDEADDSSSTWWQGNLDTRRGDILVMWCVSPRSYVHSIWRAASDGFVDPFFHFYSAIWVGTPVKTPPVAFRELAADPVWSRKPAVKAHFQGASGKPITADEYDALLQIIARKGFDTSRLPELHAPTLDGDVEVDVERDVEEKLVEPLLHKLGYSESDWIRGMSIRMGRGHRIYADYVIGASRRREDERARLIIEAKLRIATPGQLEQAYYQARSYALRLQAPAIALAAREGIWIFLQHKGTFAIERSTHRSWGELSQPDAAHQISMLIGRKSRLWA